MKGGYPVLFSPRHPEELWIPRGAEIEIVLLKERPKLKAEEISEKFILKRGGGGAGGVNGAKKEIRRKSWQQRAVASRRLKAISRAAPGGSILSSESSVKKS